MTESISQADARCIAFYLPQFHPIPENDEWWSRGFTEWTNVAKARPLFKGHYQPNIPADLGFYDLRVAEARLAQADLARQHGIEGFCYWHYWFAGKRLLERPFQEVLKSREPDFPFCLAWANESWTGVWNGQPNKILLEQTYPGEEDYVRHFHALLDAFGDERYIQMDGKPVFVVYMPDSLPDPQRFTDLWNELAIKAGLKGIYFIGIVDCLWSETPGFDGYTYHLPGTFVKALPKRQLTRLVKTLRGRSVDRYLNNRLPLTVDYSSLIANSLRSIQFGPKHYPSVIPNWDSTPRHGVKGLVLLDSTPDLFRAHLREAIDIVQSRDRDHRLIFVKSWNEWAEGNYLEPDLRFGSGYLEAIREELSGIREAEARVRFDSVRPPLTVNLGV
ncbi:MAG TPA: glycoside hydrolase family 99-like domain-containing protein [Pyrinomonadaceae bacterium]|nr:glycoside hydrolase family 99-like domain-containing protein [Pyrinomonadaceae bacterium]